MTIRLAAALAGAAMLAAGSASAVRADTVIYNGGSPDQGGQLYAEVPAVTAMSFTLAAGANVLTDAHWWGGCYAVGGGTTCGSTDFAVGIYDDESGLPGTLLSVIQQMGGANQTATGKLIGPIGGEQWAEYAYNISFSPIILTPGTKYWFALTELDGQGDNGLWGLETTSTAPAGQAAASFGITSEDWTLYPPYENLAFNLTGSAPEASTWAMALAGFAGLGWLGYTRRREGRATAA